MWSSDYTFNPASDGSVARRVGTQPVRPGSNPGGAGRSVSVSLDIGGSFVLFSTLAPIPLPPALFRWIVVVYLACLCLKDSL